MKPNLQFIFDKITGEQTIDMQQSWRSEARPELMARARAIGLSDRGVDIGEQDASQLADALLAAQNTDRQTLLRIRMALLSPEA